MSSPLGGGGPSCFLRLCRSVSHSSHLLCILVLSILHLYAVDHLPHTTHCDCNGLFVSACDLCWDVCAGLFVLLSLAALCDGLCPWSGLAGGACLRLRDFSSSISFLRFSRLWSTGAGRFFPARRALSAEGESMSCGSYVPPVVPVLGFCSLNVSSCSCWVAVFSSDVGGAAFCRCSFGFFVRRGWSGFGGGSGAPVAALRACRPGVVFPVLAVAATACPPSSSTPIGTVNLCCFPPRRVGDLFLAGDGLSLSSCASSGLYARFSLCPFFLAAIFRAFSPFLYLLDPYALWSLSVHGSDLGSDMLTFRGVGVSLTLCSDLLSRSLSCCRRDIRG
eukprot:SAG11_NODE_1557_length_4684_cov_3.766194_4_plen_334_part_00